MKLLLVNQSLVNRVAKIEIQIKLFLENVEIFHNYLKLPFFGLKIRLLFTDLFRILIRILVQNVYFGSRSYPDPANSSGSLRIWIWIRNTASISLNAAPDEIFELFYQKEFFGSKV